LAHVHFWKKFAMHKRELTLPIPRWRNVVKNSCGLNPCTMVLGLFWSLYVIIKENLLNQR